MKKHRNLEEALIAFRHAITDALLIEAKKRGYSISQFEVLKYLGDVGKASMKNVARELHVTPPSASTLVDDLVAKRLVSRVESPTDRRAVNVVLSPRGHLLMSSLQRKKSSVFNKMLSKLNTADKNELARILIKTI
jgi:DNA-binding MarR family transcriptional regulator